MLMEAVAVVVEGSSTLAGLAGRVGSSLTELSLGASNTLSANSAATGDAWLALNN
jgi:hypothetical protein